MPDRTVRQFFYWRPDLIFIMKYRILLYFLFFLILAAKPQTVEAQNVAISTNAVDWLNFGTANIGVGVDVSRHF